MNAQQAIDFIHGSLKFGSKLGLDNIRMLLSLLGNPQDELQFIHIAGTNGKGSVAAMCSQILQEAGYTVGLYTSPFVERFFERMRVNGSEISADALAAYTEAVKDAITCMVEQGYHHPTEFEVVTAIAMLYYRAAHCDFVVLETGLGGRLDATNVITHPCVTVITAISFDHMEYLGDTLTKIAAEKCGILKPGCPAAIYPNEPPEALEEIRRQANALGVPLYVPKEATLTSSDLSGSTFVYDGAEYTISLLGEHQVQNARTALAVTEALRETGVALSGEAVRRGLANTRWNARFEPLRTNPLFVIDGAHNRAGMQAFCNAANRYFEGKRRIYIMGILRDKEYEACLSVLQNSWDVLITVDVPNPRSLTAAELAEVAARYGDHIEIAASPRDAVKMALAMADDTTAVAAFGSLYLLGDIKRAFLEETK